MFLWCRQKTQYVNLSFHQEAQTQALYGHHTPRMDNTLQQYDQERLLFVQKSEARTVATCVEAFSLWLWYQCQEVLVSL